MASGSRSCGRQGSAGAGAGSDDALATLTNPGLAHLAAADLVVHLHRDDRSATDFADVALVLAVRERRLADAEARVREAEVLAGCREARLAEAEAQARAAEVVAAARERWHAEAEARAREAEMVAAGLRETIRALKLGAANAAAADIPCDGSVGAGEDNGESHSQAAGDDHLTAAGDIGAADLAGGEIREWDLAEDGDGDDDTPCPTPLMTIPASPDHPLPAPEPDDELVEERAAEERVVVVDDVAVPRTHEVAQAAEVVVDCRRDKVLEAITRKRKKPASSHHSLKLDGLIRVTGDKVSEKEAHGEKVTTSSHRRSQVEQPARATKKARKQKGTSFYTMVIKALMEKQNLVNRKKEEAFAKKDTAATSKQLYCRRCSNAPYLPSTSMGVEDGSDDGESSQN